MRDMILRTAGRFFSVSFIKRDGTRRDMTCRLGVKKHLRGGGLAYDPKEKGLVTVWDRNKKDYRCFSLDRLVSFRCGKVKWAK